MMYTLPMQTEQDWRYFARGLTTLHWGITFLTGCIVLLSFYASTAGSNPWLGLVVSMLHFAVVAGPAKEWWGRLLLQSTVTAYTLLTVVDFSVLVATTWAIANMPTLEAHWAVFIAVFIFFPLRAIVRSWR